MSTAAREQRGTGAVRSPRETRGASETRTTSAFLKACRREPAPHTPVWLMRQAGRYLPEYRALRERHSMRELLARPELAVEATLQPLKRFPFDAAIILMDILPPLAGMGLEISFENARHEDPHVVNPISTTRDAGGNGHLFNLGHGILPETPMDAVARLVDHVHAWNGAAR